MRIFHTSPEKIKKIHDKGRFGAGLFFAKDPYSMSVNDPLTYGLDVDEEDLIDASDFENLDTEEYGKIKGIIKDVMKLTGLDEEKSLSLLSESEDLNSFYNNLEGYIENYDEDDEDDEYPEKKSLYQNLSKKDLGDLGYDIQHHSLRAANALGKKGVSLSDEQGSSYLINMLGNEKKLKNLRNQEEIDKFERYEDDEEQKVNPKAELGKKLQNTNVLKQAVNTLKFFNHRMRKELSHRK